MSERSDVTFPISELVERTGVGATTIHYYVRLGLLPAPQRVAANRFEYDERHERSLRLIRALRERSKASLALINVVLPDLLELDEAEAENPSVWDELLRRHQWKQDNSGRGRILHAAIDAFSTRGFDAVNVEEICASAGVGKGSFYRHFNSKQDLYFAAGRVAAVEVADAFKERVPQGVPADEAAVAVGDTLAARLPLFLDLLIGALRNRPGYAQTAKWVMVSLAYEIGVHIGASEPLAEGAKVMEAGVVGIFWRVLMPTPVDHHAATVQTG